MENETQSLYQASTDDWVSQDLPLSAMKAGEHGLVVQLCGGRGFLSRMSSMGFTPGVEVHIIQNFGYGPLIAGVRDTRVALGRNEAGRIQVRVRAA
jgi:ferrous iron transport protein A